MEFAPDQESKSHANRFVFFLVCFGIFLLATSYHLPLANHTEGRYAEIAREMKASGDYLEPRLNGIKHFHKPPLSYWLMAAGMNLFGVNGFGVRFFGILSALVAIVFVYHTARIFFKSSRDAFLVSLIYSSSLYFLGMSRLVATDIYLNVFSAGAQYFLFKQMYSERKRSNIILLAVFMGLGFMVKGPVIFLFTILPYLILRAFRSIFKIKEAKESSQNAGPVFPWLDILLGTIIFSAIALPWYIWVAVINKGLLQYFLGHQVVDRVTTDAFNRAEPVYFFFLVFLGGFFPFSLYFCQAVAAVKRLPRYAGEHLFFFFVPLAVFTISKSKLATYILPMFGVASIVVYASMKDRIVVWLDKFSLGALSFVILAMAVIGFFIDRLDTHKYYIPLLTLPLLAFFVWIIFQYGKRHFVYILSSVLLFIGATATILCIITEVEAQQFYAFQKKINEIDPDRKLDVLAYQDFIPSISFYRDKMVVMASTGSRETQFEKDNNYKRVFFDKDVCTKCKVTNGLPDWCNMCKNRKDKPDEYADFFSSRERFFVITNPPKIDKPRIDKLAVFYGFSYTPIASKGNLIVYECRNLSPVKPFNK